MVRLEKHSLRYEGNFRYVEVSDHGIWSIKEAMGVKQLSYTCRYDLTSDLVGEKPLHHFQENKAQNISREVMQCMTPNHFFIQPH